jgi:isopentenyl diphosphate isomerase/L-lactate dehydrogenase-like FMN-dependent dehydrogenase
MTDAAGFATIEQIAARARAVLDDPVWDFLEGGAGNEAVIVANRAAYARWRFRPRVLTGMGPPDIATSVLGIPVEAPLAVAPFAGDGRFHPAGFAAVARACEAVGALAVVPELTGAPLEEVARAAPEAARVFQLSLLGTERDFTRLASRAEAAGYAALCVTADAPVVGIRKRTTATSPGAVVHLTLGNFGPDSGIDPDEYFGHVHRLDRPDWSWARLADAAATTRLPFVVKGILTAEDARAAVGAGAAGVYVSNHGGRQLDSAPATLDALAEVAGEVGDEVDVLFDGGVRSGADAVKALALGADLVLVGRPAAMGLAAAGEAGVARVLELLTHELVTTMTLAGRASLAELDPTLLQDAP